MRRLFVGIAAASLTLVTALPAVAAGPPAGAGGGGKPAGSTCQQFGIGVLKSQGLLTSVAQNGLEYPIGSGDSIPFADVLAIHRDDPALANQVLTDYAVALDIATPEVVAALKAACPPA
ncbi:hypothetical protein [Egicoccus sp. AB-alg2]|uniref:hypothetical protein n=1 Tax=Egicoccus sp. AB-alg2 TaxID=3242693 RepID=UPI00359DCBED